MDAITDQDIVPSGAAGDGTDTRRDVRGGMPRHPNPVGTVMPRQSMVAVLGVGLVLVAMLSIGITWVVVSGGAGKGESTASTGKDEPAEDESTPTKGKREVAEGSGAEAKKAVKEKAPVLGEREEARGEAAEAESEAEDEKAVVPVDQVPEEKEEEVEEPTPPAADVESSVEPPATPEHEKKKPKPLPKAYVKIASSSGLDKAEVRLGSQTFKVNSALEQRITPGTRSIKWRKAPIEPWQSAGSWNFKPGKHFVVFVSKKGPSVRTTP